MAKNFRLTGISPFISDLPEEVIGKNKRCEMIFPEEIWKNVSPEAKDLVIRMTIRDQYKRFSTKECLEHKWFQNGSTSGISAPLQLVHSPDELETIQIPIRSKEQLLVIPETGSYSPKLICKSVNEKIPDLSPLILSRGHGIDKKQNMVFIY